MSVERANECRQKAEECVAHAQRAIDSADKITWLKMAENSQKLAEKIDQRILVQVSPDKLAEQEPPVTN